MFAWFKKKKPEATQNTLGKGEPLLTGVMLHDTVFNFDALERSLKSLNIQGRNPTDITRKDAILTFMIGDELCAIALMPAPYPWKDLEGPCQTSWMWPKEKPAMSLKDHKAHLLVTLVGGEASLIERRLIFTGVLSAIAKDDGVAGVYWAEGTLVHYPPIFVQMADEITSPEAPPLYLWVDFRVFRNEDGSTGLFTTGLKALGHMEIEIPSIDMPPKELQDWVVNISYYLLEKGPVLKDGNTIGMTAEQKIRIRHARSMFGHEGLVIQVGAA